MRVRSVSDPPRRSREAEFEKLSVYGFVCSPTGCIRTIVCHRVSASESYFYREGRWLRHVCLFTISKPISRPLSAASDVWPAATSPSALPRATVLSSGPSRSAHPSAGVSHGPKHFSPGIFCEAEGTDRKFPTDYTGLVHSRPRLHQICPHRRPMPGVPHKTGE